MEPLTPDELQQMAELVAKATPDLDIVRELINPSLLIGLYREPLQRLLADFAASRDFIPRALYTIQQLEARIAELEKAQQWQPIETVPKDGRTVLVAEPWRDGKGWTIGPVTSGPHGFGYTIGTFCSLAQFTHWMPLPPAPLPIRKRGLEKRNECP